MLFWGQLSFCFRFYMNYDKQILHFLAEAGEAGLSVRKIAHHVFNATNGFFSEASYDDVHQSVRQYLQRQAQRKGGLVKRVGHGVYQLDLCSREAQQLMLDFKDEQESCPKPIAEDRSLSLF